LSYGPQREINLTIKAKYFEWLNSALLIATRRLVFTALLIL